MQNYWAFCESAFRKFFSQIVTGYLPSLILQLFLKVVPPAMKFLSSIQGYISHSDIEMSASRKVLWFTIWNVFFASVFSGSVLSKLSALLDPKNIPGKLAVTVPAQVRKCFSPSTINFPKTYFLGLHKIYSNTEHFFSLSRIMKLLFNSIFCGVRTIKVMVQPWMEPRFMLGNFLISAYLLLWEH